MQCYRHVMKQKIYIDRFYHLLRFEAYAILEI